MPLSNVTPIKEKLGFFLSEVDKKSCYRSSQKAKSRKQAHAGNVGSATLEALGSQST
jgi:hypothetical protein